PYGDGITYAAVVDVVSQLSEDHRELLTETPAAAATIASLLGESQEATIPDEIAWSMRKLLEASARKRPLVVVFDDVQWGEAASRGLSGTWASFPPGAPFILLWRSRPGLLDPRPRGGGGDKAITIALEPLEPGEVDELIDRLLHGGELKPDLAARVRGAAQGN